ncbi:MAG: UDP-N-acetylmuramoyl-L-alanine--D-glutamate ligase [Saprospiraceae bacterium]|nr:UDP-N-acetylmuramoyl-L-alanine--D-glutamate ligase [Saprospiraceae bacterium]
MKSIAVLGGGESGIGAALLAKAKKLEVFVSDFGSISEEHKDILKNKNIPFEEGGHSIDKIESADIIVKSPGIPEEAKVIRHFRLRQKTIISEIEFASRFYTGKIIGVTGSNGKTTTTSLIYHLINNADAVVGIGGNIGYAFSRLLLDDIDYDWVVLEMSSFQLDDICNLQIDIGVILNITADHLDRYQFDIDRYADAKWRLAEAIRPNGHLILEKENKMINTRLESYRKDVQVHRLSAINPMITLPSKEGSDSFEIQLKGKHNLFNAAVAVLVARLYGCSDAQIIRNLSSFKAIEHRMELVISHNEIDYINDSKATNVESALKALEGLNQTVIWIAGGTDKGNDYQVMESVVQSRVKMLICLCVDDSKLRSAFDKIVDKIVSVTTMREAVDLATKNAKQGDVVLLSPACASFDLFDNYKHRGDSFRDEVLKMTGESNK